MRNNLSTNVKRKSKRLWYVILLLFLSINLHAQISLNVKDKTVKEILKQIERESDYRFFYSEDLQDLNKVTSVQLTNESLDKTLNVVLKGTEIAFQKQNAAIVLLMPKSSQTAPTSSYKQYVGLVIDEKGDAVIGASISVKGSKIGTVTNIDGQFSIEAPEGETLTVSYVGYSPKEIKLGVNSDLKIVIQEDLKQLNEVVVVGYGVQKKVNLTGAVSTVNASMLANRTTSNTVNMLTGQAPGVTVIQNSGQPGADAGMLRIRGIGTLGYANAMVIVDGVESSFNNVNPNDIDNISVLKDAAASAIYGVRAANGVILVTTKKGVTGKPAVSYNAYIGRQRTVHMPNYIDAYNYAMLVNESYTNAGIEPPYSNEVLQKYKDGTDPDHYPNVNAMNMLLSENGLFHNHHVSVKGGTEYAKYSVALGYHDKNGLIPNSSYNKFDVRSNVDIKINDKLDFGFYISAQRDNTLSPAYGVNNAFSRAYLTPPVAIIQFQNGNYGLYKNEYNAIASTRLGGQDKNQNTGLQGNSFFEYKIVDGLSWKGTVSVNYNAANRHVFEKSITFYTADSDEPSRTLPNKVTDDTNTMGGVDLQTYLNYHKSLGKNDLGSLLGYSQQYNQYRILGASRQKLPANNHLGEINAGDATTQTTQGNMVEHALRSVFGRINYVFDNKYLVEANLRYDGSSRFPKNNRFGAFPSFAAGWRISEEDFYKASSWMDNLKLRASWGRLGNQEIGDYAFYNTYVFGKDYNFGNAIAPGASINDVMGNAVITWEKSDQLNVGLDASFLNGKLAFTGDFFIKDTKDILLQLPIPLVVGVSAPMQNAGKVRNAGVEAQLQYNNKAGDLRYHGAFNFSYIHNEITDLKEGDVPGRSVGDPVYNIYGYVCEGIFQNQAEIDAHPQQVLGAVVPGDLKYKDINGDKIVDEKDRQSLGSAFPKINFGLTLGLEYKNLDASTLLQGAGMVYGSRLNGMNRGLFDGGVTTDFLDRWTPQNTEATYPRLSVNSSTQNAVISTFWLQSAAFLKMRNIQIGYTVPNHVLTKTGISHLRIYASIDNLFTITGFDGIDPEVPYYDTNLGTGGTYYYPLTRSYSLGINLSF